MWDSCLNDCVWRYEEDFAESVGHVVCEQFFYTASHGWALYDEEEPSPKWPDPERCFLCHWSLDECAFVEALTHEVFAEDT